MKGFFEMLLVVPALFTLVILFGAVDILGRLHNSKYN